MLNMILTYADTVETVLPVVEQAMLAGEVCKLQNIGYLGVLGIAALKLLAMSRNLLDAETGQVCHPQPGFCLLAVDEQGETRSLARK